MVKKRFLALDLGTTKVAAMIGEENAHKKLHILSFCSQPIGAEIKEAGLILNIGEMRRAITKVVNTAILTAGNVDFDKSYVGVVGNYITVKEHSCHIDRLDKDELISEADIERLQEEVYRLREDADKHILSVHPLFFKVDGYAARQPVGMIGARLEGRFLVVLASNTATDRVWQSTRNLQKEVIQVFEPIASAEAVLTKQQKEIGVCLLDIGGGTTDISIYKGGVLRYTATHPFGGNSITHDLATHLKRTEEEAEVIKVNFVKAYPRKDVEEVCVLPGTNLEVDLNVLAEIASARIIEILEVVRVHLETYGYKSIGKVLGEGIVLTGGVSKMEGIDALTSYYLGLPTKLGVPCEILSEETKKTKMEELKHPMYATVIGLLSYALSQQKQESTEEEELVYIVNRKQETVPESIQISQQTKEEISESVQEKQGFFSKYATRCKDILGEKFDKFINPKE